MNKVLILGAGMVANPIIQHLLSKNITLTVAALNIEDAEKLVGNAPNGKALYFNICDEAALEQMISENDVVIIR